MSLRTQALAKFLQNQCIATPPLVINIISSILHVGWCALQALHHLDVADFLIVGMSKKWGWRLQKSAELGALDS